MKKSLPVLVPVLIIAVIAAFLLLRPRSDLEVVWVVGDGEKVRQYDLQHPERKRNSVWDGERVSLFAARNEVIGFQLILQSGPKGAAKIDVTLPELRHADGTVLVHLPEGEDPTDTRGRHVERFLQHYLHITKPSPPGWFYDKDARPPKMTGWVPDALVPFNAECGAPAAPFHIGTSRNQGIWFDIYVPREGTPAGTYEGTIKVTENKRTTHRIPVSLTVLDFQLPDTNHFHTMIFVAEDDIWRRHGVDGEPADEITARYHRLAHRHRVEFSYGYTPEASPRLLDQLSGKAFTAERGYEGPGQGIGNWIVPANFYGANVGVGDKSWQGRQAHKKADKFMTWLKDARPDAITFLYVIDEPIYEAYPWIKKVGDKLHGNTGPGGKLPMFVTTPPSAALGNSIDIWCPTAYSLDLKLKADEEKKGRRVWYYNGHRPYSGTQITDAPAVDCRVPAWACWRYGVQCWFYWNANHWQHNWESSRSEQNQNVWKDPITFGDEGGINGDGVLIYPGEDVIFPEENRHVRGPIASIRLKNIRRGAQDYEYLWLARRHGLIDVAEEIARTCVPSAFSEAGGPVSWSERGTDWDHHRHTLAQKLEARLRKTSRH
ncbi:glycoside hydrolase domain-containing protein [Verrucomicrobiota bacterium]